MRTAGERAPKPRRRWSRRRVALVTLVVVVVLIRAALPSVVRTVLEDQGTALLQGHLTVGNVDLSLSRGVVVIDDVVLRADDAGPDDPSLVAWRRFWVDIDWLALLRRTVLVEDVGLLGLSMHVDRLADGDFVLPSMRESDADEAPPSDVEDAASEPWGVVIRRLTFEDGALQLDDHVTDPPETRPLSLPTLRLSDFRLQPAPDAEPGRGRVRIQLGDGSVELRTRVRAVEGGFDLALALKVTDLPLDRVHVHLPRLGWTASTGRLSGLVTARVSPTVPLVAGGTVALDDLGIEVSGEPGPALAWRSLTVEADRIDLATRRARVARVALDGGRVLVRPTAPMLLPVLPGDRSGATKTPVADAAPAASPNAPEIAPAVAEAPEEGVQPSGDVEREAKGREEEGGESDQGAETAAVEAERDGEGEAGTEPTVVIEAGPSAGEEPVADASPADEPASARVAAPSPRPTPPLAAAWSWSVETLVVTDTLATVFLEPPPLDVDVRALQVSGLSSAPGTEAMVHAEIGVADGSLVIDGPVVLDPLGASLAVQATDLDVGRLAAVSGGLPVPLVARLDAEVDVNARQDPLVARGRVELREVEIKVEDGDEFLVAWKRLALALESVTVSGLLPFGNESGMGDIAVKVATVELDEPRIVTTLTADGLVLPPAPEADAAAPDGPGFSLLVDQLTIRDGDVRFTDTTVTPAYRGRLARLAVDATGIRIPERRVDRVTLSTRVGGKAPVEVASVRRGDAVSVTATMRDVPLSQLNPYATAYGYRIAKGTLSLDSTTTLRGETYDSESRFHLDHFSMMGTEGDTLFTKTFGVPLSVALALLRDLDGRISLDVPVTGDEAGTDVAIGSIVREALARALVGALVSPLKLLGAVRLGEGRIQAFEPAPIAFMPGATQIAADSETQAKQLAAALRQLPAVRVRVAGRAGANDARALAEQAVLADLEDEGGIVGGVRALFGGGIRARVRNALRARAEGKPGALEGDAAQQLDEWAAEHTVDQARLLMLATARATVLEALLVDGGARPGQVVVGEPKARRKSGLAEVEVQLVEETATLDGDE